MAQSNFNPVEATIDDIHAGYKSGQLTCRQVVQAYLERIDAFDKKGPNLNAMITVNADALSEADRLDAAYKSAGPVGPLHGIPVIVKDQADVKGMPTTLGSLLFKDYYPDRDSFVAEKLRKAVENSSFKKKMTVSIGVAEYRQNLTRFELIMRADRCLYQAKHGGRNQVNIHSI